MRPVTVQYFKYPRTLHWRHELVHLGEDEHGIWLGAGEGFELQRGYEPVQKSHIFTRLITPGDWWSLIYNGDSQHGVTHYIDIVTPAVWESDSLVTMIDLDLDVYRTPAGELVIDDEDEFEEHRHQLGYPADLVDQALRTTGEVHSALGEGNEPFDNVCREWWKAAAALS